MDHSGGDFCLKLLASVDPLLRVEVLKSLSHLSASIALSMKFVNELLVRIAVLLDEALKSEQTPSILS